MPNGDCMKIIVDVQKLYDEAGKRTDEELGQYLKLKLGALMISGIYPDWAEKKTATRSAKLDGGYTQDFENFWGFYPKKVGKGTAFAIWKQLTRKEVGDELAVKCQFALDWQSKLWAKDNNKFVPMPENYLKGRRWEDEAPKTAQPTGERYLDMNGVWRTR